MGKDSSRRDFIRSLEDRFTFSDASVAPDKENRSLGNLYSVVETENDHSLYLKAWTKTGKPIDRDVREIWLNELRQVQRLLAYTSARKLIVETRELVETQEEIALVFDLVGQPLAMVRGRVGSGHWLRTLDAPRSRRLFWSNILRVISAIGIVHAQGMIHGDISPYSIFTEGDGIPDFMLGGFERSVSLQNASYFSAIDTEALGMAQHQVSFAEDWKSLGGLILHAFDAELTKDLKIAQTGPNQPIDLSLAERRFITKLFSPASADLLDAQSCLRSVKEIISGLKRDASGPKTLLMRFSVKSGLGPMISDITGGRVPADELNQQLDWVRADIDRGVSVYASPDFSAEFGQLKLVSDAVVYELTAQTDRMTGTRQWDIAVCNEVKRRRDLTLPFDAIEHEVEVDIVLAKAEGHAFDLKTQLGRELIEWTDFASGTPLVEPDTSVAAVTSALMLLEGINSLSAALRIHEVKVLPADAHDPAGRIRLQPKQDRERDLLAQGLNMETGRQAFYQWFDLDQREPTATWKLSPSNTFGGRSNDDVLVTFVAVNSTPKGSVYTFDVEGILPPQAPRFFLRPAQDIGTESVTKRRLKNLRALTTREDVADSFLNPWGTLRRSYRPLSSNDKSNPDFQTLDASKQTALTALWAHTPLHYVVGPPGVGKTKLACEHIRIAFDQNPATRILVSAQGHDALDNLQVRIADQLAENEDLADVLIVRSRKARTGMAGDFHPATHAAKLLERFSTSELLRQAPVTLQHATMKLRKAIETSDDQSNGTGEEGRQALGAISELVLDSAGIVIATTNSSELERQIEKRRQFDWAIVEEAAKATGPELLSPLLLSARALLIGDHRQLPPFDVDRFHGILGDPEILLAAIKAVKTYTASIFEDDELSAFEALIEEPEALQISAQNALRYLELFKTTVEGDERRKLEDRRPYPIASHLTEQRRMDPAIADLVSNIFYEGTLTTHSSRRSRVDDASDTVVFTTPLKPSPIMVVDFPHVSASGSRLSHEKPNRNWHSPVEALAVKNVLKRLQSRSPDVRPSLTILSPYRAQVDLLKETVDRLAPADRAKLDGFTPVRPDLGFVGTIDSFQGSEADIVILSLVRNNPRVGLGAVGFLRDRRRLNVALSRARHHLIIIGSLNFLQEAVRGVNPDGVDHPLAFLSAFASDLKAMSELGQPHGAPVHFIDPSELERAS